MRKFLMVFLILSFTLLGSFVIVNASKKQNSGSLSVQFKNFNYIESRMLESSRYTQKEEVDPVRLDNFHNHQTFKPDQTYLDNYGYVSYPELEDSKLKVYIEKDSFSVIVYDKESNYYYSSRPEFQGFDGVSEGNAANKRLMNSGIWIDYVSSTKPEQSAITTSSLYTFANVRFLSEIDYPTSPTQPFVLEENTYNKNNVEVSVTESQSGFMLFSINIKQIDFKFNVEVVLDNGNLSFKIPNESIVENVSAFSVLSITLLPYFGSTRKDLVPGYMVIPDGVGALVRLDKPSDFIFNGRFYGDDDGYSRSYFNYLSVPLFGVIHEHENSGFYAHVSEGEEQVTLTAQFYGRSNYNRIYSKFYIREMSRRIIDRAGSGRDTIYSHKAETSYQINYQFLGNKASYVGIANDYRNYLLKTDNLVKRINEDNIDLYLTLLMSDTEPSLFGSKRITMTTAKQANEIYSELFELGIENQTVNLLGYSKDGASTGVVSMSLFGPNKPYYDLADRINRNGNTLLLSQNYAVAYGDSSRLNERKDVAKNINRLKMSYTIGRELIGDNQTLSYIYPEQSFIKASNDQNFINKLGVGLQINDISNMLFSVYDNDILDRSSAMSYYESILEMTETSMLSNPNSYLWKYIDGYTNMIITNSQYTLYTDLVPLVPIILQGVMPKYTPYLNFNALGKERLLQMIDFNLYPSFILTKDETYKMRYTESSYLFSTTYSDYKDEIVETYNYLNAALKDISEASLLNREVLETGVIKNTYSNGIIMYINYTSSDVSVEGITIRALEYEVSTL